MAGKKIEKKSPADQIKDRAKKEPVPIKTTANEGDFSKIVSTGSTLLDLAISGGRVRGGGIPGGVLMEIYGPSQSGKTALLAEICADAQVKGGSVQFLDPEGRLYREYSRIYGMDLDKENYHMPDTVNEVFNYIQKWEPKLHKEGSTNVIATDSLAALSSELEMGEKGDKMGMKIAKDFSQGLRKTCRLIKRNNFIIACSNQVRQGSSGETTSGGRGIPFYASIRIRIGPPAKNKYLIAKKKINEVEHEKTYGIQSICVVKKSIDDPYRTANVYIVFGVGIDDIRANLDYVKQMTGASLYNAVDKEFGRMNTAIKYIEDNNLELKLREQVIDLWEELEAKFKIDRKPKRRGI